MADKLHYNLFLIEISWTRHRFGLFIYFSFVQVEHWINYQVKS